MRPIDDKLCVFIHFIYPHPWPFSLFMGEGKLLLPGILSLAHSLSHWERVGEDKDEGSILKSAPLFHFNKETI